MNRVIAVPTALATATVAGTIIAAVSIVPAMAASRPAAARPAAHTATTAPQKAAAARRAGTLPAMIGSELDGGKYTTVVRCQGADSPPPVTLGKPTTPLIVRGEGPSTAILKMLNKPNLYKTVYTCTVVVREMVPAKPKPMKPTKPKTGCEIGAAARTCTKPVTLNTGFGGMAAQVRDHHPAG
jgi:hypothetical protein